MRGFTFVETMITTVLFSLIFGAIFSVLTTGQNSWYSADVNIDVNQQARLPLLTMDRELRQARTSLISGVPADGNNYTTITFAIPEDTDGDGDVIDNTTGDIEWSDNITYMLTSGSIIRATSNSTRILANDIASLQFSRAAGLPDIVDISVSAQKNTVMGVTLTSNMTSSVKMRN